MVFGCCVTVVCSVSHPLSLSITDKPSHPEEGTAVTAHPLSPSLPQEVGPTEDNGNLASAQPGPKRGPGRGRKAKGRRPGATASTGKSKGEEEQTDASTEIQPQVFMFTLCFWKPVCWNNIWVSGWKGKELLMRLRILFSYWAIRQTDTLRSESRVVNYFPAVAFHTKKAHGSEGRVIHQSEDEWFSPLTPAFRVWKCSWARARNPNCPLNA